MAAVTASLCCTVLFAGVFVFVSAERKIITAETEQNVTLPCRAPNNNNIGVKWSRADLETEYVLLYHGEQLDPENQHPSFKNRVDLQDRQMKDGDASLVLKDVRTVDDGTYDCRIFMIETHSWKLISIVYLAVFPEQKTIIAKSGQNITLPCRAPNSNTIAIKWSRADTGEKYVLFYRDEQFLPDNQHPSFKNRVDLQDRQMKDGDVSLILKNVTTADSGTYECRVFKRDTLSWEPRTIHLVVPPGPPGGLREHVGLMVTLVALAVPLAVLGVGFLVYRKIKCSRCANEDHTDQMTTQLHQSSEQNHELDTLRKDEKEPS